MHYMLSALRRTIVQLKNSDFPTITTKIIIQSRALLQVLKGVMKGVQRLSWNAGPCRSLATWESPVLSTYFVATLDCEQGISLYMKHRLGTVVSTNTFGIEA